LQTRTRPTGLQSTSLHRVTLDGRLRLTRVLYGQVAPLAANGRSFFTWIIRRNDLRVRASFLRRKLVRGVLNVKYESAVYDFRNVLD
jgi:hypothetical protein